MTSNYRNSREMGRKKKKHDAPDNDFLNDYRFLGPLRLCKSELSWIQS